MSTIVAGVDFGTLSVRVSLFDSKRGRLGAGIAEYPLHRKKNDPDHATQSHQDHMRGLVEATKLALKEAGIDGSQVASIALDTTGSSVIPVTADLQPLDEYYLWADHRSWREAAEITAKAHEKKLPAIDWCGGVYSSEWGFSKLLHWLRSNPGKRDQLGSAFEHCDMVAATLCGITNAKQVVRSVCAAGHKWLWNESLGGFPPEEFLVAVDPLLAGVRDKLQARFATSDQLAGHLSEHWAKEMTLEPGIPVPVGAFDAHWDAIGAGAKLGEAVNVIGTSTCIIGLSEQPTLVPGVCGVVPGSVHPSYTGIEAGLSAVGAIFDAIAQRAGKKTPELAKALSEHKAGETGLLRLTWDNGDRTVLVNPELGGVTLGWNLNHTAEDELFAAIEGTAFHTRIILERMEENGTTINQLINAGGIAQRNAILNQVYANIIGKPILVPEGDVTSLGSAIFAFVAAGAFSTIEDAQKALCPPYKTFTPEAKSASTYRELYALYKKLYFGLGQKNSAAVAIGDVLPKLRSIAASVRQSS